jgi:hypothetical protein
MAASDYVPIFFRNRLHLAGRPQMGTRPSLAGPASSILRNLTVLYLSSLVPSEVRRRRSERCLVAPH